MVNAMRVALISSGAEEFSLLHETCVTEGHHPVAFALSRSMRPRSPADEGMAATIGRIIASIPPETDLLLPGSAEGLGEALAGYHADLAVVYGFNWKLPPAVLQLPRFGVINIHSSLLPEYRGPAPVLWAIRNGDPEIGFTIHRMDHDFDTGPILAQRGGIPLDDDITPERLRVSAEPVIRDLLTVALKRISLNDPGRPQGHAGASRAGLMEPGFSVVDWSSTAREIHNQVRTFRFMGAGRGPVARVGDRWLRVLRTRLGETGGLRVECADGPIWIVESEPAEPPTGSAGPR
ncbi:formyltransferase family protein [Actinomadura sp. DC4]|uniref:methionyl-tRNA formyltransferase n=1 Tax=Actinomadura sp. DC4 TaxID=3055069 RepID=UPI0025AEDF39|nr:formyltransferase family protein [Actinomadura sp. DC4]MDN3358374.1 formyltransferase family protein [Actinomadura sp. DC4]